YERTRRRSQGAHLYLYNSPSHALFQTNKWRSTNCMSRSTLRFALFSTLVITVLVIMIITTYLLPRARAHADPVQPVFNHFLSTHYDDDGLYDDNNNGPAQQQYDDRAYPNTTISYDQVIGS